MIFGNHHDLFSCALGSCTIVRAKLWAFFHGIQMALSKGFSNLRVETDLSIIVHMVQIGVTPYHPCAQLV